MVEKEKRTKCKNSVLWGEEKPRKYWENEKVISKLCRSTEQLVYFPIYTPGLGVKAYAYRSVCI